MNQRHSNCPYGYSERDENYTLDMCSKHPEKIWGVTEAYCANCCHENQGDQDDYGKWIPVGVDKDDDGVPTLIIFACSKCGVASWTATPFCGYCGKPMKREVDSI